MSGGLETLVSPEKIATALLEIWPELPALFEGRWANVYPEVNAYLQSLLGSRSTGENARETTRVMRSAINPHERVRVRLKEAVGELEERTKSTAEDLGTPLMGPSMTSVRAAIGRRLEGRVDRQTEVSAPTYLTRGKKGFVVVSLRRKQTSDEEAEPLRIQLKYPLNIHLLSHSDHVEITEPSEGRLLWVEEGVACPPVAFEIEAKDIGVAELEVDFFQDGNWLRSLSLSLAVVEEEVPLSLSTKTHESVAGGSLPAPDLLLRVFEKKVASERFLSYLPILREFPIPGVDIEGPDLKRILEELSRQDQLSTEDAITRGRWLFEELFPERLKRFLQDHEGRIQSILIVSNEPHVPWEEVYYESDSPSESTRSGFLCERFQLTRWLTGADPQVQSIQLGRAAVVDRREEKPAKEGEAGERFSFPDAAAPARKVEVVELGSAARAEILEHLERAYDCWYFAPESRPGEGSSPETIPTLSLARETNLDHCDLPLSGRAGLRRSRPLMFLNVGRSAFLRRGLGNFEGWPRRLLVDCLCGAFLGPRWEVSEEAAERFAKAFFGALDSDDIATLGLAVREARLVLKKSMPEDLGWLAYRAYGHPHCGLQWSGASGSDSLGPAGTPERHPEGAGVKREAPSSREPVTLDLVVKADKKRGETRFSYVLRPSRGVAGPKVRKDSGPPWVEKPAAAVASVARLMEAFVQGLDDRGKNLTREEIIRRLEARGEDLYRDFLPKTIQEALWGLGDRLGGVHVLCEEPGIPWEFLRLHEPGTHQDGDYLVALGTFTRWLDEDSHPPPQLATKNILLVEVPASGYCRESGNPGLEVKTLQKLAENLEVDLIERRNPSVSEFKELLSEKDYGFVHVIAHGAFDTSRPQSSPLLLKDGSLSPMDLSGPLRDAIRKKKPLVFFNACEVAREGWGLTRLNGWAASWIGCQCSGFIAPQWAVANGPASHFAASFYEHLGNGKSLGEASLAARLETRSLNLHPLTWLAYAVYGDPESVIENGSLPSELGSVEQGK